MEAHKNLDQGWVICRELANNLTPPYAPLMAVFEHSLRVAMDIGDLSNANLQRLRNAAIKLEAQRQGFAALRNRASTPAIMRRIELLEAEAIGALVLSSIAGAAAVITTNLKRAGELLESANATAAAEAAGAAAAERIAIEAKIAEQARVMPLADLVDSIEKRGARLSLLGADQIRISPKDALNFADRIRVNVRRPELIALLRERETAEFI